jgi:hypothetical protein
VNKAPTILQMAIRLVGAIMLVLGIVLWTGKGGTPLTHFHEALGVLLVLALWALAGLAAQAGVPIGPVAGAVAWGLAAPILGFAQLSIDHGNSVPIQILHLILGLGIIGLGEMLGARMKRQGAPAA